MLDFEITKVNKIYEVNNCVCHNYYYIYYGRIYNENRTRYRKFKFIEWFDIFDVEEYFEKDYITNKDIKEYANVLTDNSYLTSIHDYNDKENLKKFYDYCNDTIRNYNSIIKY